VVPRLNGALPHIAFRLTEDAQIAPGNRWKFRFEISNLEGLQFDQSNDRSFDSELRGRAANGDIHVYSKRKKIWGN